MNSGQRIRQIMEYGLPQLVETSSPGPINGELIAIFDDMVSEVILAEKDSLASLVCLIPDLEDYIIVDGRNEKIVVFPEQSMPYELFARAAGMNRFAHELSIDYARGRAQDTQDFETHAIPGKRNTTHYFLMPSRKLIATPVECNPRSDGSAYR